MEQKDKARRKTDKILNQLEGAIADIYATSPELAAVAKEYDRYMARISRYTKRSYLEYINAPAGEKEARKKAYTDEIRAYTVGAKEWRRLVDKITDAMATVNQRALDLINGTMEDVYIENYNQVAVDCREAGIKVNG